MNDDNVVIIDRIKGVPAKTGTPETDKDPRNPNLPPEFAALGIAEGESVVISRAQHTAFLAAISALEQAVKALVEIRRAGIDWETA